MGVRRALYVLGLIGFAAFLWTQQRFEDGAKVVQRTEVPENGEALLRKASKREGLIASVVVMRHGDRAAQRTAPAYAAGDRQSYNAKFPIDNQRWPVDYGQLTGLGMKQTKNFGQELRQRYVEDYKLLQSGYDHFETHARSTDVDRTLVSAMGVMAGLYPGGSSVQNGAKGTVPVPVHTVPFAGDALMDGSAKAHCPLFNFQAARALRSDGIRDKILEHKQLIDALPRMANVTSDDIEGYSNKKLVRLVTSLRDLRVCQRAHNMTQPHEVSHFDDVLEELTDFITNVKWKQNSNGSLVGGRLLRAIANRMSVAVAVHEGQQWALNKLHEECNVKGSDSDEDGGCPRKLALYCGHDTTIFDLRSALGVNITVPGIVPYLSNLVFELTAGPGTNNYTIAVFHGSYLGNFNSLAGPFCNGDSSCSLDKFHEFVNSSLPENIDIACDRRSESDVSNEEARAARTLLKQIFRQLLIVVAAIAVGAIGSAIYIGRVRKDDGYRRIE
eukprot:Plantae.Rhodophyta-Purpureofilum_apyrenoidigerum.ctg8871.p1 GENE.Plantae.Rhodophyta-Purpureofilum_apyrenoidigerum.ctg8871~~Plantae.Rhodophyta-Purpureofilum_apyrenoidigerum.ctg8871.p1  ORF type:complete len:545 (+),score=66.42 Plantae.Rhodophyta-Purpureofilum_apyrenoidigerum.ctg8871:138-1637(+)